MITSNNGFMLRPQSEISSDVPNNSRVAVLRWKNTGKDATTKKQNLAVVLPVIANEELLTAALYPHFREYLESVQVSILKELVEAAPSKVFVAPEEVGISAIVSYLETSNEGSKLTKESVGKWFADVVAETLTVALADKLGVSDNPSKEQAIRIEKIVAAFKETACKLAGTKTSYNEQEKEQMLKMLAMVKHDSMAQRFMARIEAMKEKEIDYLTAL